MRVTVEAAKAIDIVETMGETLGMLDRLILWPGLSPPERLICMVAVVKFGAATISPAHLAAMCAVEEKAIVALCRRKGSPLIILKDGEGEEVTASEALAYGVAG